MATESSAGAAQEVNLKNPLHAIDTERKRRSHPGFETQGKIHQKSKTGISVVPQKRTHVLQK